MGAASAEMSASCSILTFRGSAELCCAERHYSAAFLHRLLINMWVYHFKNRRGRQTAATSALDSTVLLEFGCVLLLAAAISAMILSAAETAKPSACCKRVVVCPYAALRAAPSGDLQVNALKRQDSPVFGFFGSANTAACGCEEGSRRKIQLAESKQGGQVYTEPDLGFQNGNSRS
jgi:hypothetical protein